MTHPDGEPASSIPGRAPVTGRVAQSVRLRDWGAKHGCGGFFPRPKLLIPFPLSSCHFVHLSHARFPRDKSNNRRAETLDSDIFAPFKYYDKTETKRKKIPVDRASNPPESPTDHRISIHRHCSPMQSMHSGAFAHPHIHPRPPKLRKLGSAQSSHQKANLRHLTARNHRKAHPQLTYSVINFSKNSQLHKQPHLHSVTPTYQVFIIHATKSSAHARVWFCMFQMPSLIRPKLHISYRLYTKVHLRSVYFWSVLTSASHSAADFPRLMAALFRFTAFNVSR